MNRPVPSHPAELWHRLQEIAAEEDPAFDTRSVVEHYQRGAEGVRDVCRWLEIYRRRAGGPPDYGFPPHHPRFRGYCLIARTWPEGIRWEAFDDATLVRLLLPPQPDRASLEKAIEAHLAAGNERQDR